MWSSAVLVGVGGGLGATARYFVGRALLHSFPAALLPLGTLAVNLSGCFLIGLLAGVVTSFEPHRMRLELFLITGVLGGFTTFSAFGLELMKMLREEQYLLLAGYVLISVLGGLALCVVGYQLGKVNP